MEKEEKILRVGAEYCRFVGRLLENGVIHGEKSRKISGYSSEIEGRISKKDYKKDKIFQACKSVWENVEGKHPHFRIIYYAERYGITLPKVMEEYIYDRKQDLGVFYSVEWKTPLYKMRRDYPVAEWNEDIPKKLVEKEEDICIITKVSLIRKTMYSFLGKLSLVEEEIREDSS